MFTGGQLWAALAVQATWWLFLLFAAVKRAEATEVHERRRETATTGSLVCALISVGALLAIHLSWASPAVSQQLGSRALSTLSNTLYCSALVGTLFGFLGRHKGRIFGIVSCSIAVAWCLTLAAGAAISMGTASARHSTVYLVPEGYVGWVTLKYGEQAPPLPMRSGQYICEIPPSGLLLTSSRMEEGWAKDSYFYYSEGGTRTPLLDTRWGGGGSIWAGQISVDGGQDAANPKHVTSRFFVGSEEQFRHQP